MHIIVFIIEMLFFQIQLDLLNYIHQKTTLGEREN